jgi:Homeodomain-like domain
MEATELLKRWHLSLEQVRQRMYRAAQPREQERWHALWLLGHGWTQEHIATALGHDPHTIGAWLDAFGERGPVGLDFHGSPGSPPP